MKENSKRVSALIIFITVIMVNNAFAVTFNDLVLTLDDAYEVQRAELQRETAQQTVIINKNPGDLLLSLSPSVKILTETDGLFPGETDFTGSVNVKIPLGLTDAEMEKLNFARDSYNITVDSAETAKRKAFVDLYTLYQKVWLLQEEEAVFRTELAAAENKAANMASQFKIGTVSLSVVTAAEEDLRLKQEEYAQELTKQRISRYELSFTTGTAIRNEVLERFEFPMVDLPLPPELSNKSIETNPDIKAQKIKTDQMRQTIERLKKTDILLSIKTFAGINDHALSLEYTTGNYSLSAAYSFPVNTIGSIPAQGGNSTSTWNTGVVFNLSYNPGKTDSLNAALLAISLRQETARLEYMQNYVSLQIRSAYQQYLKSRDLFDQAERDLKRSREYKKIVETKTILGQTSEYERKEAGALLLRALWRVENARIEIEKSYLNTAVTASWGKFYE